jgi:hypothetical protein
LGIIYKLLERREGGEGGSSKKRFFLKFKKKFEKKLEKKLEKS